jgi:hypothetical protein
MGRIWKSENGINWEPYDLTEEDLAAIRKAIPSYGITDSTGKVHSALMKPVEERRKKRYVSRGMKEGKGEYRLSQPRTAIPVYATEQITGLKKIHWRYHDDNKAPIQKPLNAFTVKTEWPQNSKMYGMGRTFNFPVDNEELWFLVTKSSRIQTEDSTKVVSKPVYFFDVPELAIKTKVRAEAEAQKVRKFIYEEMDSQLLNEVYTAMGYNLNIEDDEKRYLLWDATKQGKDKAAADRIQNMAKGRLYRAEMIYIAKLKSAGQIVQTPKGWFAQADLNSNPKAKPLAKAMTDEEFAKAIKADATLHARLEELRAVTA